MILLTSVVLEIFTAQIISIYNYFSGLSSELVKSEVVVFFNVSSNNQRITTHSPRVQPQLTPLQAILPNLAPKSHLWPCPQPPLSICHQSLSNTALKWVSTLTSPLHFHYH